MRTDLSVSAVAARLARLRAMVDTETIEQARRRLVEQLPPEPSLARAAERRLAELRSLCELTEYLHRNSRCGLE